MDYSKQAADKIAAALNKVGIKFSFDENAFGEGAFAFSLPVRGAAEGMLKFSLVMGDIHGFAHRKQS